eukprot:100682_1
MLASTDSKTDTESEKCQLIDCYHLYNKQQRTFCSITIDIQSADVYNKSHIKNALNIPINSANILQIITDHQETHSKDIIIAIYIYGQNIEKKDTSNHISVIKDTLIKAKICKENQVFVLKDNYNIFSSKFPFLCDIKSNEEDIKEQKTTDENKEKKPENKIEKMKRFMRQNKGIYPNQIINDKLYLGDKTGALSLTVLSNLKITHIINCTPSPPDYVKTFTTRGYIKNVFENHKDINIKYMRIPIDDSYLQNIKTHFIKSISFINNALKNDNNKILVHCFAGISRSATIIIAYLMKVKGMSYDDAFSFVKEKREVIEPNNGFVEQLKKYEIEIQNELLSHK